MNKKVEDFSGGMWRLEVSLIPYDGERAEMSIEDIQPFLNETESEEPLLIRLRGSYISTWLSGSIPYKSIAIPEKYQEVLGIDLPEEMYILIPKAQSRMKEILKPEDNNFAWQIPDDEEFNGKIP